MSLPHAVLEHLADLLAQADATLVDPAHQRPIQAHEVLAALKHEGADCQQVPLTDAAGNASFRMIHAEELRRHWDAVGGPAFLLADGTPDPWDALTEDQREALAVAASALLYTLDAIGTRDMLENDDALDGETESNLADMDEAAKELRAEARKAMKDAFHPSVDPNTLLPFEKSWWIESEQVLGSCFPGNLDPAQTKARLEKLLDLGVRTMVNLIEPEEAGRGGQPFPDTLAQFRALAAARGLEVTTRRLSIPDMGTPTVARMRDILSAISAGLPQGIVHVHCWGGHGRTGTVAGCWLRERGLKADKALETIKQARSHAVFGHPAPQTDAQRQFIKDWKPCVLSKAGAKRYEAQLPGLDLRSRVLGALWGGFVGDALGVPVEFAGREVRKHDPVKEMRGNCGPWNQPKGTWSDDSSMALASLHTLLAEGDQPHAAMPRFVAWHRRGDYSPHGHCFDIGGATRAALGRFEKNLPAPWGGVNEQDNGNGSLMRLAPVALWLLTLGEALETPGDIPTRAGAWSELTHAHPLSKAVCAHACLVYRHLWEGGGNLRDVVANASDELADTLPEEVRTAMARILDGSVLDAPAHTIRGSGFVLHCWEAALWSVAQSGSYREAVLRAVNLGEDTDTTGCVAGSLAGFVHGLDLVPQDWRKSLVRHNDLVKDFNAFADRLEVLMAERDEAADEAQENVEEEADDEERRQKEAARVPAVPGTYKGKHLAYAAAAGDIERMQLLMAQGADPRQEGQGDATGQTPLVEACGAGQVEAATWLLNQGLDVDGHDIPGDHIPLHEAARHGRIPILELLHARGADLEREDERYARALHHAAHAGQEHALSWLLKHGADPLAKDDRGRTALHVAIAHNQTGCIALLKRP